MFTMVAVASIGTFQCARASRPPSNVFSTTAAMPTSVAPLLCTMRLSASMVRPEAKKLTYHIHMRRVILRKLVMGIADATLDVDGRTIYVGKDLRVGLFTSTDGF